MDVKDPDRTGIGPTAPERSGALSPARGPSIVTGLLRVGLGATVALCLALSLIHVLMVFLHVAPANLVSQKFNRQVTAWVYPLFEQNWRLFAPDPESVNRQISARTAHTEPDGTVRVSTWFDLSAVDDAAVEHNAIPSHTSQNMLRRAWTSYSELLGSDDVPHSERALLIQKYLRNIAADRVSSHHPGAFESIQLRVITQPIAAPATADDGRPAGAAQHASGDTRVLPWWKVTPDGN
ncbi:DUF5819 family protein [Streptomyces sp. NRRL F-5135]|uniref:DUF5819 family protein n=1 Tax=Streptomyces sp. NRRL F-5135 TaxID=1463858 RepID=UPI001F24DA69|nr:DUF5819 family protein [Streptomyces sp. NRRL F-5135]